MFPQRRFCSLFTKVKFFLRSTFLLDSCIGFVHEFVMEGIIFRLLLARLSSKSKQTLGVAKGLALLDHVITAVEYCGFETLLRWLSEK